MKRLSHHLGSEASEKLIPDFWSDGTQQKAVVFFFPRMGAAGSTLKMTQRFILRSPNPKLLKHLTVSQGMNLGMGALYFTSLDQ